MGYTFRKSVVPSSEQALGGKTVGLAVAHEDPGSLLDLWYGRFEEEEEEFPDRETKKDQQRKQQLASIFEGIEVGWFFQRGKKGVPVGLHLEGVDGRWVSHPLIGATKRDAMSRSVTHCDINDLPLETT